MTISQKKFRQQNQFKILFTCDLIIYSQNNIKCGMPLAYEEKNYFFINLT